MVERDQKTAIQRVAAWQLPEQASIQESAQALITHAQIAQSSGADLVCFPECFLQGYRLDKDHVLGSAITTNEPTFQSILAASEQLELYIVFGFIEKKQRAVYNSSAIIYSGQLLGTYQKRHLLKREMSLFVPGVSSHQYGPTACRFGVNICNDLNTDDDFHKLNNTTLLVCPCHNLFESAIAERWRYRHHEIRQQRAKSLDCWILSSDVANSPDCDLVSYGPTSLIDPGGTIIDRVPEGEVGMLLAALQ